MTMRRLTAAQTTTSREYVRDMRERNRRAGLCACGRPGRVTTLSDGSQKQWKTCVPCLKWSTAVRPTDAEVSVRRRAPVLSRLTLTMEPEQLAECVMFCEQFGMSLDTLLSEAVLAFMETAWDVEARA